jgi:hypothetical protein
MNVDELTPQYLGEDDKCKELHQPLRFGGLNNEGVYADYFVRFNLSASRLRENFARLASAIALALALTTAVPTYSPFSSYSVYAVPFLSRYFS